jgi:hypothetical protein
MRAALLSLAWVALQAGATAAPPRILQIYREPLKPGAEAEYDRIESDTARQCAALRCAHAYLALESLGGPKEIWWFNGFDSPADRDAVIAAWNANAAALAALERNRQRKAPLTAKGIEVITNHQPGLSTGPPWRLGHGRYAVIAVTTGAAPMGGTVYEAADGTRFVIREASTPDEADAIAKAAGTDAGARVFAVRPAWSHPADDWIAADPEFWRAAR